MIYAFPPQPIPALPVVGTDELFPVHRIYCIGRNYAEHALEMGHDPKRSRRSSSRRTPNLRRRAAFPIRRRSKDVHSRSSSPSRSRAADATSRRRSGDRSRLRLRGRRWT